MKAFNKNQKEEVKDQDQEKKGKESGNTRTNDGQAYDFSDLCVKLWSIFSTNKNYITPKNITAMIVHESGIKPKEFAANFERLFDQILNELKQQKPLDEQVKGDLSVLIDMNRIRVRNLINFIAETDFELRKPKIPSSNGAQDKQQLEKGQSSDKNETLVKNDESQVDAQKSDANPSFNSQIRSKFYKGETKFDEEIEEIRNKHKADIALGNLGLEKETNPKDAPELRNDKFGKPEIIDSEDGGENGL